eukprot:scaffold2141_cov282-Pinguiococcus_pyrenoidosus.AAC.24
MVVAEELRAASSLCANVSRPSPVSYVCSRDHRVQATFAALLYGGFSCRIAHVPWIVAVKEE